MPTTEQMAIRKDLAARGYTLERYVRRMCYARNGNQHNPTPEYTWVLKLHGKIVDQAATKRAVLSGIDL